MLVKETDAVEGPGVQLNCKSFEVVKFCRLGDIIGARTSAVDSALAKKKKLMDGASLYPLDAGDLLEVFLMPLK